MQWKRFHLAASSAYTAAYRDKNGILGNMYTLNLPMWSYIIIIPLVIWSLFWKGMALWHAAKQGNKFWFVFLFLVNTVGILDIIYLIIIGKLKAGAMFDTTNDTPAAKV